MIKIHFKEILHINEKSEMIKIAYCFTKIAAENRHVTGERTCCRKRSRPQIAQGQAQMQAVHSNHNPVSPPVESRDRHHQTQQCVRYNHITIHVKVIRDSSQFIIFGDISGTIH